MKDCRFLLFLLLFMHGNLCAFECNDCDHIFAIGFGGGYVHERAEDVIGIDISYGYSPAFLAVSIMPKYYFNNGNEVNQYGLELEVVTWLILTAGLGVEYRFNDDFSYHLFMGLPIGTGINPGGVFSEIDFLYMEPYIKIGYEDNWFYETGILFKIGFILGK